MVIGLLELAASLDGFFWHPVRTRADSATRAAARRPRDRDVHLDRVERPAMRPPEREPAGVANDCDWWHHGERRTACQDLAATILSGNDAAQPASTMRRRP